MLRILLVIVILIAAVGTFAQSGGPPMITDDPGTPDKGSWEINFSFNTELNKLEKELAAPLLDINYGFNKRTQLKLEFPWLFTKSVPEDYTNRFGDIKLGIKYRFLDEDKAGIAFSIYPQVTFGTKSDVKNEYLLPLQLEKSFGRLVIGTDVRYTWLQNEVNVIQNGILLGFDVSEKLNLMSEFVYWGSANNFDDAEGVINFGLKYALGNVINIMASAGTGVFSPDKDSRTSFISFIGIQINI